MRTTVCDPAAPAPLEARYRVRCLARSPEKLRALDWEDRVEILRRDPDRLRVGDALDFWHVEAARPPASGAPGLVRLRAEMRLPGRAWLEWRVEPSGGAGSAAILTQRALFAPRGVLGRLYWWALLPLHGPIFSSMARARRRRPRAGAHQ